MLAQFLRHIHWHWLPIIGLVISILSTLYMSFNLLDKEHKFLKAISQCFLYGMVIPIIIGTVTGLVFDGTYLLVSPLLLYRNLIDPSTIVDAVTSGFVIMAVFGGVMTLLCLFLVWVGISLKRRIRAIIRKIRPNFQKKTVAPYFLVPNNLPVSTKDSSSLAIIRSVSWRNFGFWQITGCGSGLAVAFVQLFGFHYVHFVWITTPLLIGLLISIIGGQPRKLVRQVKRRYRLVWKVEQDEEGLMIPVLQPLVSWPRFRRGFVVGFLYGLLILEFTFWSSFIGFDYSDFVVASVASDVSMMIVFGLVGGFIGGLLCGGGYGLAPALAFKVRNISERTLGEIGLILTFVGFIITTMPSLMS